MQRMPHIDAHLLGTDVRYQGHMYRVIKLQGRWAVLARLVDGFQRTVAICELVD
ncbi:hypothetical protein [Streptomyces sp. CB03238]|uniref:hypothetical protein n=1 Tax=Streptomyces sp. CB03238 TaxID=1907777 RepID=UPI0015C47570|nr:hypothetical protein [Streptomyces sp. CB03238]